MNGRAARGKCGTAPQTACATDHEQRAEGERSDAGPSRTIHAFFMPGG